MLPIVSNSDITPLSTLSNSYSIGLPIIDELQVHNKKNYGLQYLFLIQFGQVAFKDIDLHGPLQML